MKRNLLSILALGLGFTSMAQVVYTDINDVTLTPATTRETLNIDLDNDGTTDYVLFALDTTVTAQGQSLGAKVIGASLMGSNKALGTVTPLGNGQDVLKLGALSSGTTIDASGAYINNTSSSSLFMDDGGLSIHTAMASSGDFDNTTDKFIGVEFMISGALHYGWIRVDVAQNAGSVIVKDFAYEQTAGAAIEAGQTTAVNENELVEANVFYANNQLNIRGIEGNYNISVIDLLGKSISNEKVNGNTSINLNMVNNGIYLVKITKGNSIVTKKVYIK